MNMSKEYFDSIVKSYITKEEFISMLETLDFKAVKCYDIDLITDFYIKVYNDNEIDQEVKTLGYNIRGE